VTGVPWSAVSILRHRDFADKEEADMVRRKIAACFTVFVRRGGAGPTSLAQSADQSVDASNRKLEKISPGMIAYVEGEGDVTPAVPPSAPDDGDAERQQYAFAAGTGLPFATLTGNLKGANYSSLREGKLDFWTVLDQLQWHMCVPQIARPAWKRVMRAASGRGMQISPDLAAKYAMPKRPWVDPKKDLEAAMLELQVGLNSWPEMAAERGFDPDDLLDEIQQWKGKLEAAGITFSAPPGQPNGNAAASDGQKPAKPDDVTTENDDGE
jgi:capsid protein